MSNRLSLETEIYYKLICSQRQTLQTTGRTTIKIKATKTHTNSKIKTIEKKQKKKKNNNKMKKNTRAVTAVTNAPK